VHGADPGLAQLQLDAEVEVRGVDADEHVRLFVDQGADQPAAALEQFRQATEHLDQAHHRQALHGEIAVETLGLHARPTDADELCIGMAGLDGLHQAGAEDVAGRLAGDQGDLQGTGHAQRVMPRVEPRTEAQNSATSGCCAASSASSARASSTVSPLR